MNERRRQTWFTGMGIFFAVAALVSAMAAARFHTDAVRARQDVARLEIEIMRLIATATVTRETVVAESDGPTPVEPLVAVTSVAPAVDAERYADELARRDGEIQTLRARIAELQAASVSRPAPAAASPENRMHQWWQRLRERDPDAYARRMQETRERMTDLAEMTWERMAFMQQVPTAGLAPEYLENHEALLERLQFFHGAMQQMADDPESPDTMALMPQVMARLRGLDDMLAMQRQVLLDDLAREIGYRDDEARQFVEAVTEITEVTALPSPSFFRRDRRAATTSAAPPIQVP